MLGFVGLGHMGGPIAERIVESQPLVVFDVRADAIDTLVVRGAEPAESLANLAQSAQEVFICVNTEEQVLQVVDQIVRDASSPGTMIILSTVGPECILRLCAQLEPHGWTIIDCPVSGTLEARSSGELTAFLGASAIMSDAVTAAIEAFSGTIYKSGPPGSGQASKLVNNILTLVSFMASIEAIRYGNAYGMSLSEVQSVVASATGDCYTMRHIEYFQKFKDGHPLGADDDAFFSFMAKDLHIASKSGADHGVKLPFIDMAADIAPRVYSEFW